eukprot:scaffold67411_cov50-Phaeocystis_antarctica.AAC.2
MIRFHALHDVRRYTIPQCCSNAGPLTPLSYLYSLIVSYIYSPAREDSPCPVRLGEIVGLGAFREADRPGHAALEEYEGT